MRRVFGFGGDIRGLELELDLDLALARCILLDPVAVAAAAASPQCAAAAAESGSFTNLLHGAHPPRPTDCDCSEPPTEDTMQYSTSFPTDSRGVWVPTDRDVCVPAKIARLPSVRTLLLGVATRGESADVASVCHTGSPDRVALDAGSPKPAERRFFLLPPLEIGLSPERPSARLARPRRQLSLQDLLCADAAAASGGALLRRGAANHRRQCGVPDCLKYALAGGFCIRHGGGKRCSHAGCRTVAQSGGKCKAHGGGSKCKVAACGSVARRRGYCMAHGGRQQCKVAGCAKCAHGGGFCISHGGGKRCSSADCAKSAQAGGFCYSHGGGKRCAAPECFQAARKGGLCIRHRKAHEPPSGC